MVCIILLCVQPIPILSASFLCHPYIPLSNLENFSFTCTYIIPDTVPQQASGLYSSVDEDLSEAEIYEEVKDDC